MPKREQNGSLLIFYLLKIFFFLTINLSNVASIAGKNSIINIIEHKVPLHKVIQILAVIAVANIPTTNVTITSIEPDVSIV